jgi:hypothetical protein
MASESTNEWRVRTADVGLGMLFARIAFLVGSAITLYLAYPWLANWYFGKWARRLVLGGRKVNYTGTPSGIVGMWFKVWLLSTITLTVYWWIRGRSAVNRYMDAHVEWA